MTLWVLGGIIALGIGIWLGLPGDSRATEREIEQAIMEGRGGGPSKRVRRRFTPIEWIMRKRRQSTVRSRSLKPRQPFSLASSGPGHAKPKPDPGPNSEDAKTAG